MKRSSLYVKVTINFESKIEMMISYYSLVMMMKMEGIFLRVKVQLMIMIVVTDLIITALLYVLVSTSLQLKLVPKFECFRRRIWRNWSIFRWFSLLIQTFWGLYEVDSCQGIVFFLFNWVGCLNIVIVKWKVIQDEWLHQGRSSRP